MPLAARDLGGADLVLPLCRMADALQALGGSAPRAAPLVRSEIEVDRKPPAAWLGRGQPVRLDREQEAALLARLETHIIDGERRISEQTARIERLRSLGHDTSLSERLLANLQDSVMHARLHRRQILAMLEGLRNA